MRLSDNHQLSLVREIFAIEAPENRFGVKFGCDATATLGYLDFFDFEFDLFDWSPELADRYVAMRKN